ILASPSSSSGKSARKHGKSKSKRKRMHKKNKNRGKKRACSSNKATKNPSSFVGSKKSSAEAMAARLREATTKSPAKTVATFVATARTFPSLPPLCFLYLLLLSLAHVSHSSSPSAASSSACVFPDLAPSRLGGISGDVLTDIVCPTPCHHSASQWSPLARSLGPLSVTSPQQCWDLCPTCRSAVYDADAQACLFTTQPEKLPDSSHSRSSTPMAPAFSTSVRSSYKVPCDDVPFPVQYNRTYEKADVSDACAAQGFVFGDSSLGSCADAELLAVYTDQHSAIHTLTAAAGSAGWFQGKNGAVSANVTIADSRVTAVGCRGLCTAQSDCGGWSLRHGVCFLYGEVTCPQKSTGLPFALVDPNYGFLPSGNYFSEAIVSGLPEPFCVRESDTGASLSTWFGSDSEPRCTEPSMAGKFIGDTYQDESKCYYKIFSRPHIRGLLRDKWIVLVGGSNNNVLTTALVNFIDDQLLNGDTDFFATLVDIIWDADEEEPIYVNMTDVKKLIPDWPYNTANWDETVYTAFYDFLDTGASIKNKEIRKGNYIRVTKLVGKYWFQPEAFLKSVVVPLNGDLTSEVVFWTQPGQWYLVCGTWCSSMCPRKNEFMSMCGVEGHWMDRRNAPVDEETRLSMTIDIFEEEMHQFLEEADPWCSQSGFTCFVVTGAYTPSQWAEVLPLYSKFYDLAAGFPSFHVVNEIDLGSLRPEEVQNNHNGLFLSLWIVQQLFNTIANSSLTYVDSTGSEFTVPLVGMPEPLFASPSCMYDTSPPGTNTYGGPVGEDCVDCDCLEYHESTRVTGNPYRRVSCVTSRRCTYFIAEEPPVQAEIAMATNNVDLCTDLVAEHNQRHEHLHNESLIEDVATNDYSNRLWHVTTASQEVINNVFAMSLIGVAALALLLGQMARSREKISPSPPPRTKGPHHELIELKPSKTDDPIPSSTEMIELGARVGELETDKLINPTPLTPNPPQTKAVPQERSGERLAGITLARMLASVHIVAGHMYQANALSGYFYSWGYTWVPWFFMLSGYVLTHARLNSRDPGKLDRLDTMLIKRTTSIYPLYCIGLLVALVVLMVRGGKLPWNNDVAVPISMAFLLQAWNPYWVEKTSSVQLHCWFLSAMIIYWLSFNVVYGKFIRHLSVRLSLVLLFVLSLLPWLMVVAPEDKYWYRGHQTGSTATTKDVLVAFFKFNPLCYFHVFIYGMALANLRHKVKITKDSARAPLEILVGVLCDDVGALVGYAGLIMVFSIK
ncbi:hypothetical protein TrLO_g8428, partial [Triparma laevis f. longispina]